MSNSLVVGIDGTIGSALFTFLQCRNGSVFGSTYRNQKNNGPNTFYLNLSDHPMVWNIPVENFNVVYICAGISNLLSCEKSPELTRKINILGMKNLIQYFSDAGAFIVFLSTNHVFSGNEAFVLEHSNYQPRNEYGQQKAEIEKYLKLTTNSYAIVRLTKVIPPNMSLIRNWMDLLCCGEPIEAYQDMVLAPVTLKYVVEMLAVIGARRQQGSYQISGPDDITYYQLANCLADFLGCSCALVQPINALDRGVEKKFLPRFTTLDCSSIMALGRQAPPHYSKVIKASMGNLLGVNKQWML